MFTGKVGVINNMNAKKNRTGKYNKDVMQPILGDLGFVKDTYTLEEMENAVDFFIEKEISFLGINGGDGSIQKIITTWINKAGGENLPKIIPLAGGSTNVILLYLDRKPVTPIETLNNFVLKLNKYQLLYSEINLLKIEIEQDNFQTVYGFSFANGVVYKLVEMFLENNKPSVSWIMKKIMQIIGGVSMRIDKYMYYIRPIDEKAKVDGKVFPENKVKATVMTSFEKPFPTFTVFKSVDRKAGEAYYMVSNLAFPAILNNIHNILFGLGEVIKGDTAGEHWIGSAKELSLFTKEGFMFDGELYKPEKETNITVSVGPLVTLVRV